MTSGSAAGYPGFVGKNHGLYPVVQSELHAHGAAIDIAVTCSASHLCVVVSNARPVAAGLEFAASDGGHGLARMRERVITCGGSLTAGPTDDGGWNVTADLPAGGLPASV